MVEQPKYLEMTLSQLKLYVESSESKVLVIQQIKHCLFRHIKTGLL